MKIHPLTRRHFLKQTGGWPCRRRRFLRSSPPRRWARAARWRPANRIAVGCIGIGPQGLGVMGGFLGQKDAQVVAVCDVKNDQLEQAAQARQPALPEPGLRRLRRFPRAARPQGHRRRPHRHARPLARARCAGRRPRRQGHLLEKPMGSHLAEDQVAAPGRAATQARSSSSAPSSGPTRKFRLACELVRNGRIGKLKHINVWAPASAPGRLRPRWCPSPPGLNYDFWLGPAPSSRYTEDLCSADGAKKTWWFNSDYALGFIAGWGIHPIDIAVWGGGDLLHGPIEVEERGHLSCRRRVRHRHGLGRRHEFASGVTLTFVGVPNGGNKGRPPPTPGRRQKNGSSATAASPATAPLSRAPTAGSTWTARVSTCSRRTSLIDQEAAFKCPAHASSGPRRAISSIA